MHCQQTLYKAYFGNGHMYFLALMILSLRACCFWPEVSIMICFLHALRGLISNKEYSWREY